MYIYYVTTFPPYFLLSPIEYVKSLFRVFKNLYKKNNNYKLASLKRFFFLKIVSIGKPLSVVDGYEGMANEDANTGFLVEANVRRLRPFKDSVMSQGLRFRRDL